MNTTIDGVRLAVDLWPTVLGALLVAASMLLAWRVRAGAAPADIGASPDLRGSSAAQAITATLSTMLLVAMAPPVCSGAVGRLGKAHPQFIDELLFPVLAIDFLIVVAGALVMLPPSRRTEGAAGKRVLATVLALLGALIAIGGAWSVRMAKRSPELARHSCTTIQKGRACSLQISGAKNWQTVGMGEIKYDQPGEYKVPLRLRSGLAEASGEVTIQVGEDRGSPFFSPRAGDVWQFSFEKRSVSAVLLVVSNSHSVHNEAGPTVRGMRELEAHGRRWLQIEVETQQRESDGKIVTTKERPWIYFWNGETFLLPDQDGAPKWWATQDQQRVIVRPDLEPMPTDLDAQRTRERTLARIPETTDGLSAVTVPCVFSLFDLSCRCAERGIDAKRSLPGPVLCYAGSSGLRTVGLLLLTAFTVLDADSTMLMQTESGNHLGLPPPQPPLPRIPTQEEYELAQAAEEAAKPPDAERQAYAQDLASRIPRATPIPHCVERHAGRRHGSVAFSSLLDRKGKVRAVTVKELRPALPRLKACIEEVVRNYDFGPPPNGGIRIESATTF